MLQALVLGIVFYQRTRIHRTSHLHALLFDLDAGSRQAIARILQKLPNPKRCMYEYLQQGTTTFFMRIIIST
jgi:hypothetical protein